MHEAIVYYLVLTVLVVLAVTLAHMLIPGLKVMLDVKLEYALVQNLTWPGSGVKVLTVRFVSPYPIHHVKCTNCEKYTDSIVLCKLPGATVCTVVLVTDSEHELCTGPICVLEICADAAETTCKSLVIKAS